MSKETATRLKEFLLHQNLPEDERRIVKLYGEDLEKIQIEICDIMDPNQKGLYQLKDNCFIEISKQSRFMPVFTPKEFEAVVKKYYYRVSVRMAG